MPRLFTLLAALLAAATAAAQPPASVRHAAPAPAEAAALCAQAAPREIRAVWLTTYGGLDWPASPAHLPQETRAQQEALRTMLDRLQAAGINVVLFQSRIRATTAWESAIEPYDGVFAGSTGSRPGYDPLRFAIEECHRRGMECHAWIVAFPLGKHPELARKRPELCRRAGTDWYLNPAAPGTPAYLASLCAEVTRRYDVDGIHLDYIRYPEPAIPFRDDAEWQKADRSRYPDKRSWRAAAIDRCVQAVHDSVKALRPYVRLSCSPIGKYADLARYSSHGWNARDAVGQHAQEWLRRGWMDMLFPMMYFDGLHFYPFLADWHEHESGRWVAPGIGIYQLSPAERDWPLEAVQRQLAVVRGLGLAGQAYYRARFLTDDVKGLYGWLARSYYRQPALVPAMTWADSEAPAPPKPQARREGRRLCITWPPVTDSTPVSYNVYRLDGPGAPRLCARRLRATTYETAPALPELLHCHYAVCTADAYGNESTPAVVRAVAP